MPTQSEKRQRFLDLILDSESEKKLIVAGPGTGKTYTFKQILNKLGPGNYFVLSFIRKLVDDLAIELGESAEVKTFHAFCKKVLHERQGKVDIYPKLPEIIKEDAELFGYDYSDFESKFRNLKEKSPAIFFFLRRGDYYQYLSFDDSVYRLYKRLKKDISILDSYDLIIVDEYQDFNKLEVEFIKELEKRGPILIAGDDDQAIYSGRSSTPEFLREAFNSGDYTIFELPYCSRCPVVVVNAVNEFISVVQSKEGLNDRLEKQYLPFTEGNEDLNNLYPRIKIISVPVIKTISKYIDVEINKIPIAEIIESNNSNSTYPTVLIIGQRHYLQELYKILIRKYPQIEFDTRSGEDFSRILDGIKLLINDINSNLGWRILAGELLSRIVLKATVVESNKLKPFGEILDKEFKNPIIDILELVKSVKQKSRDFSDDEKRLIKEQFQEDADLIINHYSPIEKEDIPIQNPELPTILLRTFEGCKGLSGGHVFIVGANDGSMPKINDGKIEDIEVCKFIVALTRTRKQCHIISNRWLNSPVDKDGKFLKQFSRSTFLELIPSDFIEDQGYKKAAAIK